jgi:hypothetical protein
MPVSVVVLVFEVADDHAGFEQGVPRGLSSLLAFERLATG